MSRRLVFAYPGDLDLKTGGYAYDRAVVAGLSASGWEVEMLALGDGFPAPDVNVKATAERALSALPDGCLVLIDGLAFGVLDDWAIREKERLRIAALVHHPLALETGLDATTRSLLQESETRALTAARRIIVTSPMTARELISNYGVRSHHVMVAMPGTEPGQKASGDGDPPHILAIGTLVKRKGHDVLLRALGQIADLPWSASIVGSKVLDPETATSLEALCGELGLTGRVTLAGECNDTREILSKADIFALASRYEGYGMVFAEALSHGLPIVACHAGAVPDVVPADAGLLVPVNDVDAFADALRLLVSDREERARRAEAAFRAGRELPRWSDTTATISSFLETMS